MVSKKQKKNIIKSQKKKLKGIQKGVEVKNHQNMSIIMFLLY